MNFSNMMRGSSGLGGLLQDDEFLPDFEQKEIDHKRKLESQIVVTKKPDSMLRHGEDVGGVPYKYDLPMENKAIEFKSQLIVVEEIPNTPVENMFEAL